MSYEKRMEVEIIASDATKSDTFLKQCAVAVSKTKDVQPADSSDTITFPSLSDFRQTYTDCTNKEIQEGQTVPAPIK